MLYVDVDVKILFKKGKICAHIHKSIKESYVSKHYFEGEKNSDNDISIEEELFKTMTVTAKL